MIDYVSYIALKIAGGFLRGMPPSWALFCGRRLGDITRYIDMRHRAIVYANIRQALGARGGVREASRITREFYRLFCSSLVEILLIPRVDAQYMERFITIEGAERAVEAFKRGKGVIFLGVHEGSWELYNVIAAHLGYPMNLLVRGQEKYPRVARLLNNYRQKKGCKLILRENQTRNLIRALRDNEAVGMSLDQGGKSGVPVMFFGKEASMAIGALRLALKYDAAVVPVFFQRVKGPRAKVIIAPAYALQRTGDLEADIRANLQGLTGIFEALIRRAPGEYFWRYKIWKYGRQRTVLILNDGKTGHLRQSQAVAARAAVLLRERGFEVGIQTVEVAFAGRARRALFSFGSMFSGKYQCQGCLACVKACVTRETCAALSAARPDLVISCGSSLAGVTYLMAREHCAKSVVLMRPPLLGLKKFDLVVMPRHDVPPPHKNICVTDGALNLIDEHYLKDEAGKLIETSNGALASGNPYIGMLIGGDTKHFHLKDEDLRAAINAVKAAAVRFDAQILVTTSRRTKEAAQRIIKDSLANDPRCTLLIIANERNVPEAVGGILGLSTIVVTSPESISMISEAASSGKHTVVFDSPEIRGKHRVFLRQAAHGGYIHVVQPPGIERYLERLWRDRPPVRILDNGKQLRDALSKIL